jgi:hypothetical protein
MGTGIQTQFWQFRMYGPRACRRIRRVLLAGLVLAVLPAPVGAQSEEEDLRRLRSVLPEAAVTHLRETIEEAERDGVPGELLFRKALEGVSKGQSADAIVQAVDRLAHDLRFALSVVGPGLGEDALDEAAEALARGVDESVVRTLATEHKADFSIMLLVVEDLIETELTSERAHDLLDLALEHGYRGDRLFAVSSAMRRLTRDQLTPEDAAERIEQFLRDGVPLVPPASARQG